MRLKSSPPMSNVVLSHEQAADSSAAPLQSDDGILLPSISNIPRTVGMFDQEGFDELCRKRVKVQHGSVRLENSDYDDGVDCFRMRASSCDKQAASNEEAQNSLDPGTCRVAGDASGDEDQDSESGDEEATVVAAQIAEARAAAAGVHRVTQKMHALLFSIPDLPMLRRDRDAVAGICLRGDEPRETVIVIRGPSGAGKSSLINSILGQDVLPTSSSEGCTAVPTKISYSSKNDGFSGEIEFISLEGWTRELEAYCSLLQPPQTLGELPPSTPFLAPTTRLTQTPKTARASEGFSFQNTVAKLESLYKKLDIPWDDVTSDRIPSKPMGILTLDARLHDFFGKTINISACSAEDLREQLRQYDDPRACHFWPLISEIRVCTPSDSLSNGAVLVDLPGTGDCNAARNEAAARYIRDYDHLWICLDMCRAKSNKELEEIFSTLGDSQLRTGKGSISFVLTKCEQGTGVIERSRDAVVQDVAELRDDAEFAKAHSAYKALGEQLKGKNAELKKLQKSSKKRKGAESVLEDEIVSLSAKQARARRTVAAIFCKIRAQSAEDVLKNRFLLKTQKLAHRPNTAGGEKLIYTTATQDMDSLATGNSTRVVFASDEEDTGVPELRRFVTRLSKTRTISSALEGAELAISAANSLVYLLDKIQTLTPEERRSLQERWDVSQTTAAHAKPSAQSIYDTVAGKLESAVHRGFADIEDTMAMQTGVLFTAGAADLKNSIAERCQRWGTGSNWSMLRAACKNGGKSKNGGLDMNQEIAEELIKALEVAWSDVVQSSLANVKVETSELLRHFVCKTFSQGLTTEAYQSMFETIVRCQIDLHRSLELAIAAFQQQSRDARIKELSACIKPKIEAALSETYAEAAAFMNKGSTRRRRDHLAESILRLPTVVGCTATDFDVAALATSMREMITPPILDLARDLEERLSRMWRASDQVELSQLNADEKKAILQLKEAAKELLGYCGAKRALLRGFLGGEEAVVASDAEAAAVA